MELDQCSYEFMFKNENLRFVNHFLNIPSEIARANIELTMITLVIDNNYKGDIAYDYLDGMVNKFCKIDELYYAFYINDNNNFSEEIVKKINKKHQALKNIFIT